MKKLLDILYVIYQFCIALPILLVLTFLAAFFTLVGSLLGGKDFWGYWPGMIWGRLFCLILLLPVKIEGRENIEKGKAYVVISNHQSYFDCFLLYGYLGMRFKWLMKKELGQIPIVGTACRACGHIMIDRSNRKNSYDGLAMAADAIKRGVCMIIFPEGTRTPDGKMGRFKKGAFTLSSEIDAQLLPVTINGAYDVMSRHAKRVYWHPLSVTFHAPIAPAQVDGLDETERNAAFRAKADEAAAIISSSLHA